MTSDLRPLVALAGASVVPPTVSAAIVWVQLWPSGGQLSIVALVFVVAWLVSLAHLIVIGLPAFAVLKRSAHLRWLPISVAGFLAGSVPLAILTHPSHLEGYFVSAEWHGQHVAFYENGDPTRYEWLVHAEKCLVCGVLGILAAITFWLVWSKFCSHTFGLADNP